MSKTSRIGASNLYTNNAGVFGSMAGLAPTANVRPRLLAHKGYSYKYNIILNDAAYSDKCGTNKTIAQQITCLTSLNLMTKGSLLFRTGRGNKLG
jgi:hypothetical protein